MKPAAIEVGDVVRFYAPDKHGKGGLVRDGIVIWKRGTKDRETAAREVAEWGFDFSTFRTDFYEYVVACLFPQYRERGVVAPTRPLRFLRHATEMDWRATRIGPTTTQKP